MSRYFKTRNNIINYTVKTMQFKQGQFEVNPQKQHNNKKICLL